MPSSQKIANNEHRGKVPGKRGIQCMLVQCTRMSTPILTAVIEELVQTAAGLPVQAL